MVSPGSIKSYFSSIESICIRMNPGESWSFRNASMSSSDFIAVMIRASMVASIGGFALFQFSESTLARFLRNMQAHKKKLRKIMVLVHFLIRLMITHEQIKTCSSAIEPICTRRNLGQSASIRSPDYTDVMIRASTADSTGGLDLFQSFAKTLALFQSTASTFTRFLRNMQAYQKLCEIMVFVQLYSGLLQL